MVQNPEGAMKQSGGEIEFLTSVGDTDMPKFLRTKNTLTKMGECWSARTRAPVFCTHAPVCCTHAPVCCTHAPVCCACYACY